MMGVLNRVINILILLAAIAAAVFSYLLFSKREKLVNGWTQMASAITVAAKTLDDGGVSGTSAVRDLPEAKLKHTNSDELGLILPKLKENISKVVTQRNDLSDSIRSAAKTLSINEVDDKYLKSVSSYKEQERAFQKGVEDFRKNRDSVSNEYSKTFKLFGAKVSAEDLNSSKTYRSAITRGNLKVKDVLDRRDTYLSFLKQTAKAAGVPVPKVEDVGYRDELTKMVNAVRAKKNELAKTKKQLVAEQKNSEVLKGKLTVTSKSLKNKTKENLAQDNEIKRLNNILSKDNTLEIPKKLLTAKDPECYKYVKGIVEYIDKDYGFITINIGKNYSFVQEYGTKPNRVFFPLQTGKIMTVMRNPKLPNELFIAKIIVTKVDDNSSVCNIISRNAETTMQEGDLVYFTDEDIEKAMNAKPGKAKK